MIYIYINKGSSGIYVGLCRLQYLASKSSEIYPNKILFLFTPCNLVFHKFLASNSPIALLAADRIMTALI
jgi:hypothetical protein